MGDDGFYYRDGEKVGFVISCKCRSGYVLIWLQIAAQELKEIGMDVSAEIPAQTDWAVTDGDLDLDGEAHLTLTTIQKYSE